VNLQIPKEQTTNNQQELNPHTLNEINHVIQNLKVNKAAGQGNMLPELIRNGDRTLKWKLYKLILKMWNEKQMPAQCKEGIICSTFKKENRLNCNNYRPITLLNIAYKIYAILL
jgi:hypothetical protein